MIHLGMGGSGRRVLIAARMLQDRLRSVDLITQLGVADHPLWLQGDFVGALTALTGERFAYDVAAWQGWWARHRSGLR